MVQKYESFEGLKRFRQHGFRGEMFRNPLFSKGDSLLSPGDISFAGNDFEVTSTFATTKLATTKLATTKPISNPVINQNAEALNNIQEGIQNVEESLEEILTILEDISNKTRVFSTASVHALHMLHLIILYSILLYFIHII